jgi:hypothetical protein
MRVNLFGGQNSFEASDQDLDDESAEPETLYKEFVQGWGRIYNYEEKIIVCLSKKRSTGSLINAPFFWMVL